MDGEALAHVCFAGAQKGSSISAHRSQLFGRAPGEILAHPDPRDLMVIPMTAHGWTSSR